MTDNGGHGVSGAGRHKAAGGARLWIAMGTATHMELGDLCQLLWHLLESKDPSITYGLS